MAHIKYLGMLKVTYQFYQMLKGDKLKCTSVVSLIDGSVGQLEIRHSGFNHPAALTDEVKLVVLSHPHPLYGGTMSNKVVTTMERAFQSLGYLTVAYNFRGVGKSQGAYDQGEGEQDDLLAVLHWAKAQADIEHITLAGFSFGSYVSLNLLQKQPGLVDAICTVAPPVGLYDFSEINPVDIPWTLIQGGEDEVVSAPEILAWVMSRKNVPDIYWRACASHFLHGELIWLKKIILMVF